MSIQGSESIDWDDLILDILDNSPVLGELEAIDLSKEPHEELACEVIEKAMDDAEMSHPGENSDQFPNGCCPACFLINTLQDPDCIWGQIIARFIHPRYFKRWAEKHAIHWCQDEKPSGRAGRPKRIPPESKIEDHQEVAA